MALSLEEAKELASQGYESFGAAGSYGEGGLQKSREVLAALKKGVTSGELKITDYQDLAEPMTSGILQSIDSLVRQGQGGLASQISEDLRSKGFLNKEADNSSTFKLPFSRTEYAKLPTNVLPTQEDVDKGLIARDALPFQRYQNPTGGGTDAQGNPIPADINLGSDRGAIELEAQRQAGQLKTTLDEQKTLRDQNRQALAQQLATYQQQQFDRAIPQLTENANTQGILRSTGFGEQLARKYGEITQDSENQLAMQGLKDSEAYTGGLGDIANVRSGLQTSGLQRDFSLDDNARSMTLAQQLAQLQGKPSSSASKSTGTALGTVAGGIGGAFVGGPAGAAAGSTIGGSAGSLFNS